MERQKKTSRARQPMANKARRRMHHKWDQTPSVDIMEAMNNSFLKHGAIDPMHSINLLNVASIIEDREFIQYVVDHIISILLNNR